MFKAKLYKNQFYIVFIRVRVLGTDYVSSWVRELTWALLQGEELFAPAPAAPAATLRSESLGSSSVYSKVCHTRITRLEASGLGFGDVVVAGGSPRRFQTGAPPPVGKISTLKILSALKIGLKA